MVLYIENTKDANRKLLERIDEFGKVVGFKINIQKSVAYLYIYTERPVIKSKKPISFTITSKRIKYLGIPYLRRKKTCTPKTMTLMKETGDDTDGKIYHVLGLEEAILSK